MKKWMILAAAILVVLGIGFAVKGASDKKQGAAPEGTAVPETTTSAPNEETETANALREETETTETEDGAAANRDLPWFYLVLLRGYQALYDLDGDPKYVDIFIRWMDWARRNARDAAGLFYNDWSGKKDESATPKWLLDEACIPEYFVRAALIRREVVPAALPR